MDTVGQLFSKAPTDLLDDDKFNERYVLRGPKPRAIKGSFTPATVDLLLEEESLTVEVKEGWMIVYRLNRCIKVEQFEDVIDLAIELAQTLETTGRD